MSLRARIEALPEQEATKSRDYGRGYAQAIKDVLALLPVPATVSAMEAGMSLYDQQLLREARSSVALDRDQTYTVD